MAEHVQAALDQMVAPLRDLMDRHIFTETEIRSIVSRRRESEYLLRRRAARKADFVRYIEAEMLLEKLRTLRTAQRKQDHRKAQHAKGIVDDDDDIDDDDVDSEKKKNKEDNDDPIGDAHIVQHIHLLFVRAIRKFRGDISLHLKHAEFCKLVKSWTRLGKVYAEALQVFPRQAGIWIEAASNEFFGPNRSVKSARVLLQRALRLNGKSSEELWIQYFSLELHYAQTLKGRRKILHPEKKQQDEENDEDDKKESDSEDDDDDGDDTTTDYNKIPLVILRNAILAIPKSVQFRLKFLDVCQKFPDTTPLMDYVQTSMEADFANEPESWIARAIYQAETKKQNEEEGQPPKAKKARTNGKNDADGEDNEKDNKDPVIAVLEEAIDTLQTSEMLLQAFRFAEDYRKELEQDDDNDTTSTTDSAAIEKVDEFIRSVWSKASSMDSSELVMEQTRYLLTQGQDEEAVQTIKAYCTKSRCSTRTTTTAAAAAPVEAWILWTSLVSSMRKQKSILERALQTIPMDTHPDYVTALLQFFGAQMKTKDDEKALFGTLQKLLLLAPKTVEDIRVGGTTGLEFELADVFAAYLACLDHFYKHKGIQGARSVYEAVLFRSTAATTLSEDNVDKVQQFVDRCLELEVEQQEDKESNDNNNDNKKKKKERHILRKLYDKAVDIFAGTSLEDSYRKDRNEKAVFAA